MWKANLVIDVALDAPQMLRRERTQGRQKRGQQGHGSWAVARQFEGNMRVLGRTLEVNDRRHTIVGVMPPDLTMHLDTGLREPTPRAGFAT